MVFRISNGRSILYFKKFFSNSKNIESLISFLRMIVERKLTADQPLIEHQTLILAVSEVNNVATHLSLLSPHEEADIRIILHTPSVDKQ